MICTRGDVRRGTDCRIRQKFLAKFNGYDLRNVQESRAVNVCEVVQSLSLSSRPRGPPSPPPSRLRPITNSSYPSSTP